MYSVFSRTPAGPWGRRGGGERGGARAGPRPRGGGRRHRALPVSSPARRRTSLVPGSHFPPTPPRLQRPSGRGPSPSGGAEGNLCPSFSRFSAPFETPRQCPAAGKGGPAPGGVCTRASGSSSAAPRPLSLRRSLAGVSKMTSLAPGLTRFHGRAGLGAS